MRMPFSQYSLATHGRSRAAAATTTRAHPDDVRAMPRLSRCPDDNRISSERFGIVLHPLDDLLPEQSVRPEEEEEQRHQVSHDVLHASSHHGPEEPLPERFRRAHDDPAKDGARDALDPA